MMLESYFFIPANRDDFLKKSGGIQADYFVIDFEDAVNNSDLNSCIETFRRYGDPESQFIRPDLWAGNQFSLEQLQKLIQSGGKHFVLPKLQNAEQLRKVASVPGTDKLILLVETPELLLNLGSVCNEFRHRLHAVAFGSIDFSGITGMKDTFRVMNHARFQLRMAASAYKIPCIDSASFKIDETEEFEKECINAFEMGFSSKFIIHPRQLSVLNSASYYTEDEIAWAKAVLRHFGGAIPERMNAVKVDGQLLEKPLLSKIRNIQTYLEKK